MMIGWITATVGDMCCHFYCYANSTRNHLIPLSTLIYHDNLILVHEGTEEHSVQLYVSLTVRARPNKMTDCWGHLLRQLPGQSLGTIGLTIYCLRLESAELWAAWLATWLSLRECLLNNSTCLVNRASLSWSDVWVGEEEGLTSGLDCTQGSKSGWIIIMTLYACRYDSPWVRWWDCQQLQPGPGYSQVQKAPRKPLWFGLPLHRPPSCLSHIASRTGILLFHQTWPFNNINTVACSPRFIHT